MSEFPETTQHDLRVIGQIMADHRPDLNGSLADENIVAIALLFMRLRLQIGDTPEMLSLQAAANVILGYEQRTELEAMLVRMSS